MKYFWVIFFFILSHWVFSQTKPGPTQVESVSPPRDILVCDSTRITLDAGPNGPYLWSTGDTTRTIVVYENRTYAVKINGVLGDSVSVIFRKQKLNYANNWYFGQGGGLIFSGPDSVPSIHNNPKNINFPAGNAIISDNEGNIMFYTNGSTIYNKKDSILASGINGDTTAAQNSIIIPNPGSIMVYNLFTIRGDSLFQTVIDMMKTPDTLGGLRIKNKFLFTPVDAKLTAVSTADQKGMWLIAHQKNSNTFVSFQIKRAPFEPGVVLPPVLSQAGKDTISFPGYLKSSSDGKKLALANKNSIEVFSFDSQTGKVSSPEEYNIPNAYGLEFSKDGNFLYASTLDSTRITKTILVDTTHTKISKTVAGGSVFQIDLNPTLKNAGKNIIDTLYKTDTLHPIVIGALQMGLDGKIYGSVKDSSYLAQIKFPETKDSANSFVLKGFDFNKKANLGLPNFPQNTSGSGSNFGFTYTGNCARPGTPVVVHFTGFSSYAQEHPTLPILYSYLFSNDTTKNFPPFPVLGKDTSHTYNGPGSYLVGFVVQIPPCKPDTNFGIIVIDPYPNAKVSSDTICEGDSITLHAGNKRQGAFYVWENTTSHTMIGNDSVITIKKAGAYRLIIGFGDCLDSTDFAVNLRHADLNLPDKLALCSDEIKVLDAGPGRSFKWTTGDTSVVIDTTQRLKVNKTAKYILTKVDNKGCKAQDTTVVYNFCEIYVPNAFTPNGHGPIENEVFKAYGEGLIKFDMKIFNRWGELIFVSNDINKGWDGIYKGQLSPVGSYAFVIEFESQGITTKISGTKKGDVTLLR